MYLSKEDKLEFNIDYDNVLIVTEYVSCTCWLHYRMVT